jgi:hypothetical protein
MARNPEAHAVIDAPIEVVWAVMVDTARYGEWNSFVREAECPSPPNVGDPIVLHVEFTPGSRRITSPERISVLEPPAEPGGEETRNAHLAYVFEGWPARLGLVRGTRHQRLTQEPGGPTRYDTVEEFSGPLVALAGPKRVQAGFERHATDLKSRAEALAHS